MNYNSNLPFLCFVNLKQLLNAAFFTAAKIAMNTKDSLTSVAHHYHYYNNYYNVEQLKTCLKCSLE